MKLWKNGPNCCNVREYDAFTEQTFRFIIRLMLWGMLDLCNIHCVT